MNNSQFIFQALSTSTKGGSILKSMSALTYFLGPFFVLCVLSYGCAHVLLAALHRRDSEL